MNRLTGYLDEGSYTSDNNRAENVIRPFVIGRQNWLFNQRLPGAKASVNIYSLIETAKFNDVNLYDYFKAVLILLPNASSIEDVEQLLPWKFKRGLVRRLLLLCSEGWSNKMISQTLGRLQRTTVRYGSVNLTI
jgi:hypothetical protein